MLRQWYYVKLATQSCPKIELFRSLYHIWWRLRRGGSKYGFTRRISCTRDSLCKYNLPFCRMQDFFHRRCLPRFGFPLTSRHASVDAASAGAATQSTPSGGALTNGRSPSSSTSRYPAVHASVERSLRCEKPLAAIRLPANAASALAHKLAVGMLPCPITPLSTSADAIAVNTSRKPQICRASNRKLRRNASRPFFPCHTLPSFLLQRMSIPRLLCPACTACGFVYHNHNPQVMRRNLFTLYTTFSTAVSPPDCNIFFDYFQIIVHLKMKHSIS